MPPNLYQTVSSSDSAENLLPARLQKQDRKNSYTKFLLTSVALVIVIVASFKAGQWSRRSTSLITEEQGAMSDISYPATTAEVSTRGKFSVG